MVRNSYYKPGSWNLLELLSGCSQSFRLWQRQTSNANTVLQALSEGCQSSPLSGQDFSQRRTLHRTRGVAANGKVLVNDPNDGDARRTILTVNLI